MQEKLDIELEEREFLYGKPVSEELEPLPAVKVSNPVAVPPIPTPPQPPPLSEFQGLNTESFEDDHPYYPPKGKKSFVAHLDKKCFHVTEGRYFGLSSNYIADPHFVGANAPGILGISSSLGATGLATASIGGQSWVPLLDLSGSVVPEPSAGSAPPEKKKATKEATETAKPATKPAKKTVSLQTAGNSTSTSSKFKLKPHVGPLPTANASDLRKLMDVGGALAEEMKTCIIRAAVHASRSGKHGQSFLAPNGKAYPDVSKAFAAHAGLKPCQRCKNNKQGVSCTRVLLGAPHHRKFPDFF